MPTGEDVKAKETELQEIKLKIENRDKIRQDEEWTEKHESLVYEWRTKCEKASESHNVAGKKNKCNHVIFGLPAVIIPIIFSPLSVALENEESLPYVSMVGFILTGIFSSIDKFFNYGSRAERHFNAASRYDDLVTDIKYEMVKNYKFRVDPDQFLMRIQNFYDSVSSSAPDI